MQPFVEKLSESGGLEELTVKSIPYPQNLADLVLGLVKHGVDFAYWMIKVGLSRMSWLGCLLRINLKGRKLSLRWDVAWIIRINEYSVQCVTSWSIVVFKVRHRG